MLNYTSEQIEAINTVNDNLQIIACAGSGKTQVISQRIVNILKNEPSLGTELTHSIQCQRQTEQEYDLRMTAEMIWSRGNLLQQAKSNAYLRHKKAVKQHNSRNSDRVKPA